MLKKRLVAVGVATVFTLSSLTTSVSAADFNKSFTGTNVKIASPVKGQGNSKNNEKKFKFNDCYDTQWAITAIEKLAGKGILSGTGNGQFAPKSNVTHLEAFAMVLRLTGDSDKADSLGKKVHPYYTGVMPLWGYGYVYIAIEKGILLPEELKDFNPNKPAKRHEIAKYIIRAMGRTDEALDNMDEDLDFKDSSAVPDKSVGYVYLVNDLNIMVGDDNNKFNPMEPVTRAQMAVLLDRAEGKFDTPDTDTKKSGIVFVSANEAKNKITVTVKGTTSTYEYLDDVSVYKNNKLSDIDDLVKGDTLKLYLNNNKKVIFIEVVKQGADEDKDEASVDFSEISYSKLPEELQNKVDSLKAAKNYKAYEYDGYVYLLATMGKKNTGGYYIDIEKVTRVKNNGEYTVKALVDTDEPSSSSMVTQAVTYPYSIVRFKSFANIKSIVFVDGDGDTLKKVNIDNIADVTAVEGKIYELVSGSRTIRLEKSNGAKVSYTIPSSAEITVNGDDARFSDLKKGMPVELKIIDNKVTEVIAEDADSEDISFKTVQYGNLSTILKEQVDYLKLNQNYKAYEYDGDIYLIAAMGKKTSSGYSIDIEKLDKVASGSKYIVEAEVSINTPSSSKTGNTVYPYSVVKFSKLSNISSVRFVKDDGGKLAEVNIVKLDELVEVKGTIDSINTGKKTINVKKSNGSVITLAIPSGTEITVNGDEDESFSDLKNGMSVEIKLTGNVVTRLVAEDTTSEAIGTLTGINIGTEKKITLKVGSSNKTYTVASDVDIITDDDDNAKVEDLKIGSKLTLTFVNGLLTEIEED